MSATTSPTRVEALKALYHQQVAIPHYRADLTESVHETTPLPACVSQGSARSSTWRRLAPRGSQRSQCPWSGPSSWLHGDVHSANLLINDGRLAALLDFGDLAAGDLAVADLAVADLAADLMSAWGRLPVPARPHFRELLGDDLVSLVGQSLVDAGTEHRRTRSTAAASDSGCRTVVLAVSRLMVEVRV